MYQAKRNAYIFDALRLAANGRPTRSLASRQLRRVATVFLVMHMTKAQLEELEAVLDAILPTAPRGWTTGPTVRPQQRQVMRCFERGDLRAFVFIARKSGEDALCVGVAPKDRGPAEADLEAAQAAFSPWGGPARREDLGDKTLLYWTVSDIRHQRPRAMVLSDRPRRVPGSVGDRIGRRYRGLDVH
jgi:hypothetical protein